MPNLLIIPNVGIGNIELGINREEVHKNMGHNYNNFKRGSNNIDAYYSSCFQVNYDEHNKVEFIEIARSLRLHYDVIFEGVNIFKTKADELVRYINTFAEYDKENWETKIGCTYIFKEIGLSLWRPDVFKEETLQEEWFKQLSQDQKEEQMGYMYFETVGLATKGYWN